MAHLHFSQGSISIHFSQITPALDGCFVLGNHKFDDSPLVKSALHFDCSEIDQTLAKVACASRIEEDRSEPIIRSCPRRTGLLAEAQL